MEKESDTRLRLLLKEFLPELTEKPNIGAAVAKFAEALTILGVPLEGSRRKTPERFIKYLVGALTPKPFEMTTFTEKCYGGMVLVRDIPFTSLCEHHLLAFKGKAHVAYLPNTEGTIVGLSKIPRTVYKYSARLQTQERLTFQIAADLYCHLNAHGVGVILEAEHSCMTLRGACAVGSSTRTAQLMGNFHDADVKSEFFSAI